MASSRSQSDCSEILFEMHNSGMKVYFKAQHCLLGQKHMSPELGFVSQCLQIYGTSAFLYKNERETIFLVEIVCFARPVNFCFYLSFSIEIKNLLNLALDFFQHYLQIATRRCWTTTVGETKMKRSVLPKGFCRFHCLLTGQEAGVRGFESCAGSKVLRKKKGNQRAPFVVFRKCAISFGLVFFRLRSLHRFCLLF